MSPTPSRNALLALLRTYSWKTGDFVLASGKRSDYYIDLRRTSLTGAGAHHVGHLLLDAIEAEFPAAEGFGGMTLGADPLTTATGLAAFQRGKKLGQFLVRKAPKDHGTGRQVEAGGELADGARVVLLEDTVTTGSATLAAWEAVTREGYVVEGAVCVVDRLQGGREALAERGVRLHTLFTVEQLRSGS